MTNPVTYAVVRDEQGKPYILARLRSPDLYEAITPKRSEWKKSIFLLDMIYSDWGELISEAGAKEIAESWGATF